MLGLEPKIGGVLCVRSGQLPTNSANVESPRKLSFELYIYCGGYLIKNDRYFLERKRKTRPHQLFEDKVYYEQYNYFTNFKQNLRHQ